RRKPSGPSCAPGSPSTYRATSRRVSSTRSRAPTRASRSSSRGTGRCTPASGSASTGRASTADAARRSSSSSSTPRRWAAPKHLGISYLLVDMRSPGITVRPLVQITGDAEFNEVFFEDVRVPKANLVGRENEGWQVAMTTLQFERVGLGAVYSFDRLIRELTTLARRRTLHGRPAI